PYRTDAPSRRLRGADRSTPRLSARTQPLHKDRMDRGRARVLVVDDEPTIGEVVDRYLGRAGYQAGIAATGRDALSSAAAERPDVVVLDLMLPDLDGLEVMRRLRRDGREHTAIILLTAR